MTPAGSHIYSTINTLIHATPSGSNKNQLHNSIINNIFADQLIFNYMSNTFSQIYIQVVFAVKGRECQIQHSWENQLYKYITGIVQNHNQKMIAINGMPDHIHFLIGMKPTCCLSDLVREIKKCSNTYIKENRLTKSKFQWQDGFGAFSYSHSSLDNVVQYVMNQKEHHVKKTFKQEYEEFLTRFNIEFKSEYVFEWYE